MDDAWLFVGFIAFVALVCGIGLVAMLPGLYADVQAARARRLAEEKADWR